mgnify:CR=1 FL=1
MNEFGMKASIRIDVLNIPQLGFALGFQSIFVAIEDLQQCQMIALSVHNLLALLQNFIFVLMGIVKYIFD